MDFTVGLATSIKEIAALVHDLRQQQQEPVNRETTPTTPPPVRGASVDPPPTPGTNRLNLPGGLNPTFQGAASSLLAIVLTVTRTPHQTPTLTRTTTLWVEPPRPRRLHLRPRGSPLGPIGRQSSISQWKESPA